MSTSSRPAPSAGQSVLDAPVITSWEPPGWADTASVTDGRVEYYRPVGTMFPADQGQPAFSLGVQQSDELAPAQDVVGVRRGPAGVVVLGVRLSAAEARELAQMLTDAVELIS